MYIHINQCPSFLIALWCFLPVRVGRGGRDIDFFVRRRHLLFSILARLADFWPQLLAVAEIVPHEASTTAIAVADVWECAGDFVLLRHWLSTTAKEDMNMIIIHWRCVIGRESIFIFVPLQQA